MTAERKVLRVLGIDPGSRCTGFGVIDYIPGRTQYIASGTITVAAKGLAESLKTIFNGVTEVVRDYQAHDVAIENVFFSRNVYSALRLGQARGVAIAAAAQAGLVLTEYSPTQIKQAVVGKGNAKKTQVQHMVQNLLGLAQAPGPDAADALACALCHCQHISSWLGRGITHRRRRVLV